MDSDIPIAILPPSDHHRDSLHHDAGGLQQELIHGDTPINSATASNFLTSARALTLASATVLAPAAVQAALPDGSYAIDGQFDDSSIPAFTGSFDVVGNAIVDLEITLSYFSLGSPSIYAGPGVNEDTGTMLSGSLLLTNLGLSASGSGFLNLASDGRFRCGGVSLGATPGDYCQISTQAYGTDPDELVGSYSVTLLALAPPPEPDPDPAPPPPPPATAPVAAAPPEPVPTFPLTGFLMTGLGVLLLARRHLKAMTCRT